MKLITWRETLASKGVPEIGEAQSSSVVYGFVTRTLVVFLALFVSMSVIVPLVRVMRGWSPIAPHSWSLLLLVIPAAYYNLALGWGAVSLWSSFRVKHPKWHFIGKTLVPVALWVVTAIGAVVSVVAQNGVATTGVLAFLLLGVPALLALQLPMSRSARIGRMHRFAEWMARPVWQQVQTRLDRHAEVIKVDLKSEVSNVLYTRFDGIDPT
ncbi:hypothetical protein HH308_24145 [Gordonia sp. TBRC 11910]|uniref:Uncharacterized protein n=1 Tax=Gordonia asplenii TaxID=2725283 RepID=A0A848L5M0_9ACTN|nr:hypothetical protein [Gordonia asplenii]NMO04315.1 hypothetical protein [Gordonia asplenii]